MYIVYAFVTMGITFTFHTYKYICTFFILFTLYGLHYCYSTPVNCLRPITQFATCKFRYCNRKLGYSPENITCPIFLRNVNGKKKTLFCNLEVLSCM